MKACPEAGTHGKVQSRYVPESCEEGQGEVRKGRGEPSAAARRPKREQNKRTRSLGKGSPAPALEFRVGWGKLARKARDR